MASISVLYCIPSCGRFVLICDTHTKSGICWLPIEIANENLYPHSFGELNLSHPTKFFMCVHAVVSNLFIMFDIQCILYMI